jgi:hypothetical protein
MVLTKTQTTFTKLDIISGKDLRRNRFRIKIPSLPNRGCVQTPLPPMSVLALVLAATFGLRGLTRSDENTGLRGIMPT